MNEYLRLPNITGGTPGEQVAQIQSYLHQLVQQLNWALSTVEEAKAGNTSANVVLPQSIAPASREAMETFNSIKSLIIKSADIVKAYEDTIRTNFKGKYFADSDFGTFVEETNRFVEENSRGVTEAYESIQTISTDLTDVKEYVETTEGYIKRGILSNGSIGIEVGETRDEKYHRYAQFTAERLTFFDINGNPVAYIGSGEADKSGNTNCLYVTGKAVFLGGVQFGGYKIDTSDGIAFIWI